MTGEAIEAQVLRFLRGHPGSSLRAVRSAVPARNASVDEALRALNLARRASCTEYGWFALRNDGTRVGRTANSPSGRQVSFMKAVRVLELALLANGHPPTERTHRLAEQLMAKALPTRQREQHQREERRPA